VGSGWRVSRLASKRVELNMASRGGRMSSVLSCRSRPSSLSNDQDGQLLIFSVLCRSYSIPLEIGSPPRTYYLQLDTASSDVLLASTLCSSPACRQLQSSSPIPALSPGELSSTPLVSLYNPSSSASFGQVNGNNSRFSVRFLDNTEADGYVARESVSWGGVVGPEEWRVGARNQTIGMSTSWEHSLESRR
jgi:hypothetical protein